MYLNININDRVSTTVSIVSAIELLAIRKSIASLWVKMGVVSPVTSVPNTPLGEPGEPDVTYDQATGLFTFSIPVGAEGSRWFVGTNNPPPLLGHPSDMYLNSTSYEIFENRAELWYSLGIIKGADGTDGTGLVPQGEATVAEINTLNPSTLTEGMAWLMLDAGTITVGTQSVDVVVDDWISWTVEGYFVNVGQVRGPQGVEGPQGDAATLNVGTTTTGSPGSNASVTNSGTDSEAVFNFTIPRGDIGDQGDQGGTGADGPQGEDGPVGDIGPQGEQGIPGMGIYPQGTSTVAALNALVADPAPGEVWVMLDAGTITYGSQTVDVIIDDWVGWGAEGYFVNLGPMEGPAGADGAVWFNGSSDPVDTLGIDGDYYLNNTSSDYFTKIAGTWGAALGNLQGIQGANGADGTDGVAATLDVGTTTTGAAGSDADVTNSGTTSAAIFDFIIPRGDAGTPGADSTVPGPTGPAGPTAISTDANNIAVLGVDTLTFVDGTKVVQNTEAGTTPIATNVSCTQAEYDLLTPVINTLYVIIEG